MYRKEVKKMNNIRKNFNLTEDVLDEFKNIKRELNLKTDSAVLTYLIRSYRERNNLSENIVIDIEKKFKNTFDRIRLASQFSERYSYTILDAVNTLLYEFDNAQILFPAKGDTTHKVVRASIGNLKRIIEERKQLKDDREKKKEENREE